jgi:hypothetical protein
MHSSARQRKILGEQVIKKFDGKTFDYHEMMRRRRRNDHGGAKVSPCSSETKSPRHTLPKKF